MSSANISDRIVEKLNNVVTDKTELKMIIDLLQQEKRYSSKEKPQAIKKDLQLMINQYFRLEDSSHE